MLDTIRHDDILELRLDRPPANALDPALIESLHRGVEAAPREGARAIVLSGAPGMFSGGLDVPALVKLDRDGIRSLWQGLYDTMRALANSPVPVAAAITGHSPAGGAVLAICCDYRVMAEGDFKIGLNEVRVGITLPPVLLRVLRRIVGDRQAERLAVGGLLVDAQEAQRIGLVDELVPVGEVTQAALHWCRTMLELPRQAMSATRQRARAPLAELFAQPQGEIDEVVDAWYSAETQAALRALIERLAAKKR
jgi:enoyl-CoA hydratase/carnithine racemase